VSSKIFSHPLPYLALLIAHIIWGINTVVAKITLQEFPPMSLAFLRFTLATIFLIPFFLAETKKVKINSKDIPKLTLIGILIITLNIAFFFEGLTKTSVVSASVLTLTVPIFSVLLGWLFLKEKIYTANLAGILFGFLGALVILNIPLLFLGTFSPEEATGNLLIVLASLVWVIGSIVSRQMLQKYPSMIVTSFAFLVGVVTFLLPAAKEYLTNPLWIQKVTMLGVFGLFYMTLLSSISAYFLFEWGLAKTSVSQANLFNYIMPFISIALAVIILNEKITTPLIFGSILIFAGVYLGTLAKEAHHKIHKFHRY